MYPPVVGYGDFEVESFDSYFSKWPKSLSNIPIGVVQDWIYRHWRDFSSYWLDLKPHQWSFELTQLTTEKIHSIDHISTWINDLDVEEVEYVNGFQRGRGKLAQYMLSNGIFPVPIIVAKNAGHIVHPRSNGEMMKAPFQLIEGHSRLACIRGMINANHPKLQQLHDVWLVTIP